MIHTTHSAGGIVRNSKGEIAVVLHDGDFWGFPKGHIDEGEDALTAAKREIAEEIGISTLDLKTSYEPYTRIKAGDENKEDQEMKTIHMFLCETPEEEFKLTDPQHAEARWVPVSGVVELLTHPKDKEFFGTIQDSLK
jgi:bis(5'-nucleosidyl)-tetraphosphatase